LATGWDEPSADAGWVITLVSMPEKVYRPWQALRGCNVRLPGSTLLGMAGGEHDEMTCRELVEVVSDYLEDRLSERDRLRLEAHLAECPYCAEYVDQMRQTIAALGELPPEPVDPRQQEQLLEAFRGWRRA